MTLHQNIWLYTDNTHNQQFAIDNCGSNEIFNSPIIGSFDKPNKVETLYSSFLFASLFVGCSGINTHKINDHLEVSTLYSSLSNVHIVKYNDAFFMVDAGIPGEETIIENQLDALGLQPNNCKFILLTHGHTDHAGTAAYFQSTYNIPIISGIGDTAMIRKGINDSLCPTGILGSIIKFAVPEKYDGCNPDILVYNEIELSRYQILGKIIATKGHTPGRLILQLENIAFVGDMIRGKAMAKQAPELHFYQCDLIKNEENIIKTLNLESDLWFAGHFGPLKKDRVVKWLSNKPFDEE